MIFYDSKTVSVQHLVEILTGPDGFIRPAHAITYGPHTGLSSMVLQRKGSQGRTGHMISKFIFL